MRTRDTGETRARQEAVLGRADSPFNPLDSAIRALGWDSPLHTDGDRKAAEILHVHPAAVRKWRLRRSYPTGLRLKRVERLLERLVEDLRTAKKIRRSLSELAEVEASS